jgi:proline racemase
MIISTVEMHTGGEPTRIIVDGWPKLSGKTLLDKRRAAKERFDHLRRGLMLEPRGHDGMYGALLVEPDHPEADLAVLFMHNEGYSTMCGHATIALARWAIESGRVKGPIVRLQCPCGLVVATVAADGGVRFESVPSFAYALDRVAPTASWGRSPSTSPMAAPSMPSCRPIRSASIFIARRCVPSPMPARRSRGPPPRPCRSSTPASPISPFSMARS